MRNTVVVIVTTSKQRIQIRLCNMRCTYTNKCPWKKRKTLITEISVATQGRGIQTRNFLQKHDLSRVYEECPGRQIFQNANKHFHTRLFKSEAPILE